MQCRKLRAIFVFIVTCLLLLGLIPASSSIGIISAQEATLLQRDDLARSVFAYITAPPIRDVLERAAKLYQQGNIENTLKLMEEVLSASAQTSNRSQTAAIALILAQDYLLRGDPGKGMKYLSWGEQEAIDARNKGLEAFALAITGLFSSEVRGEYEQAMVILSRAVATARKGYDFVFLAYALTVLGSAQARSGQLVQARKSLDEALQLSSVNRYESLIPGIRMVRGNLLRAEKNIRKLNRNLTRLFPMPAPEGTTFA